MAMYRKKPVVVEAEMFKLGMEDGYASYSLGLKMGQTINHASFIGFFEKGQPIPKANNKPAIKTLEGWYEVEEGRHYIVTGVRGERYPVEKEIFEETYELVE